MATPKITDFMVQVAKDLIEKKEVTQSTANSYLRTMCVLNDKVPFKTLSFLRNKEGIINKLSSLSESSQKTQLAAIVSVLSTQSDKPTYKGLHKFYLEKMMEKIKSTPVDTNKKTKKQEENWLDWETIMKVSQDQWEKVKDFASKKTLTPDEYDNLLQALVLGLYVYLPPRRNQDYLNMIIAKKWKDDLPIDVNYLDLSGDRFVFNKYKTAKKYGSQIVDIPVNDDNHLGHIIAIYLKHQPLYKQVKGKTGFAPFLVNQDGKIISAVNSITRLLNKIFGKRVGSSMLRHIFLTDKYGKTLEEQKEDSAAMGHSLNQQREYIKHEIQSVEIPTTDEA
jgi:integrase